MDQVQNVALRWSEEIDEHLQDCFESIDWSTFKGSAANLSEYAIAITQFITRCVNYCMSKKSIPVFPN